MDSVVVNTYIIYKKKVNARMSLFHFKVILAEMVTNRSVLENKNSANKNLS